MAEAIVHAEDMWSKDRIDLIKATVCKGATNDELALFLEVAKRLRLDPLARQIFAVKRWDASTGREVMSSQVSIDGLRLVAERSGLYAGQMGPQWCGLDGEWKDVWLEGGPPAAAKVGVLRKDWAQPLWAVAKFESYVPTGKDGKPTRMWAKMGDHMIAKVAEALALRRTFPNELSGVYSTEEMEQSGGAVAIVAVTPRVEVIPKAELKAAPKPELPAKTKAVINQEAQEEAKAVAHARKGLESVDEETLSNIDSLVELGGGDSSTDTFRKWVESKIGRPLSKLTDMTQEEGLKAMSILEERLAAKIKQECDEEDAREAAEANGPDIGPYSCEAAEKAAGYKPHLALIPAPAPPDGQSGQHIAAVSL